MAGAADLFEEVATASSDDDATAELEQFLSEGSETPAESEKDVEKALNESTPKAAANEKTPEDLLSEFEKMLG